MNIQPQREIQNPPNYSELPVSEENPGNFPFLNSFINIVFNIVTISKVLILKYMISHMF